MRVVVVMLLIVLTGSTAMAGGVVHQVGGQFFQPSRPLADIAGEFQDGLREPEPKPSDESRTDEPLDDEQRETDDALTE